MPRPSPPSNAPRLTRRLDALEARLRQLEGSARRVGRGGGTASDRGWILEGLRAQLPARGKKRLPPGRLGYGGIVHTPDGAHYEWRGEHPVEELLDSEWSEMARAFGALGHRVRLDILRALVRGIHDVSELQRQPGLGTSGQLYHHLRELQAAGWVRQQERSRYRLVPDRVVAVLLMVGIAMGPDHRPEGSPQKRRKKKP
jgi:DNA-binding HxlR family transcriptional regulator